MTSQGSRVRPELRRPVRRATGRLVVALGVATLALAVAAAPAFADTSQATAQAASLTLLNQPVVTTGTFTASNDGTGQTTTGNSGPALSVLGTQSVLGSGVLAQQAQANNDGSSAACAGTLGAGGTIQIGPNGTCVPSGAATNGVVVNLAPGVTLTADAVLATCTAASDGTVTGAAQLVNAKVNLPLLPPITLAANPAPNTGVTVPGIATLTLNSQSTPSAGSISVSALTLAITGVADLSLGTVTCGPNAATPPIPVIPVQGLPIAGATVLAAIGCRWWWVSHHRRPITA